MRFLVFTAVLLTVVFFPQADALPVDQALQARTSDCVSNCASLIRMGRSHVVVAKDATGQIFKVLPVDLPVDARLARRDQQDRQDGVQVMGGGTTETRSDTYETATEIVVITYVFYYDADGNLIDIDVNESRFPRDDTQQEN